MKIKVGRTKSRANEPHVHFYKSYKIYIILHFRICLSYNTDCNLIILKSKNYRLAFIFYSFKCLWYLTLFIRIVTSVLNILIVNTYI